MLRYIKNTIKDSFPLIINLIGDIAKIRNIIGEAIESFKPFE